MTRKRENGREEEREKKRGKREAEIGCGCGYIRLNSPDKAMGGMT